MSHAHATVCREHNIVVSRCRCMNPITSVNYTDTCLHHEPDYRTQWWDGAKIVTGWPEPEPEPVHAVMNLTTDDVAVAYFTGRIIAGELDDYLDRIMRTITDRYRKMPSDWDGRS